MLVIYDFGNSCIYVKQLLKMQLFTVLQTQHADTLTHIQELHCS